jgi:hypothetical protein
MHKSILNSLIVVSLLSLSSNAVSAQQKASTTPTLDAMEAGIVADPRVKELQSLPPEQLVSEAIYTVEWPQIHERDIYWKCRIFRTVDFRDEKNKALIASIGRQRDVAGIFVDGAMKGRYKVYSAADDRFTFQISSDSLARLLKRSQISATSKIQKFLVKQDWLYLAPEKKLVCRIIGIAPILETVAADGVTTETPLFWIYCPPMRPYLREQSLPSIDGSASNLDVLFEQWKFSSPIVSVRKSDQSERMKYLSREQIEKVLNRD